MMKLKSFCRRIRNSVWRVIRYPKAPLGALIMLHRIDTPNECGVWYNQHLKMSPESLEEMIEYARKHKCRFVSLDEMAEAINQGRCFRRWIAVTLDDGYRDNYLNGAEVFSRMNVPFTIYVCTKMVKGEMVYWWEIIEDLVLKNREVTLSDGRSFDCSTKEKKEKAFLDIREVILKQPQNNLKKHLIKLFANYDIDWNYGNDNLGLTWEQINELKNNRLATIGNHTYSHYAFKGLSEKEICNEIDKASDEMLENTGIHMSHFAFPYGDALAVSQHDVELVKGLGFKTVSSTYGDFVCYGSDLQKLPRFFVSERNWKQVIDRIIECC